MFFKRLDVIGEPRALRCETAVREPVRAGRSVSVYRVKAYAGEEAPQDIKIMQYLKNRSQFVPVDTLAAELSGALQKLNVQDKEIITKPDTQDSQRYDRAFSQARRLSRDVDENFANGQNPKRGVIYTKPNLNREWQEAIRYPEFQKLGKDAWIKIASQGRVAKWSSLADVGNVDTDLSKLDPEKVKRTANDVKRNKVELPIVGRWPNGRLDLIGGNTRVATLSNQGHDPRVWVVDVPGDVAENFADGRVKGKSRPGRVKRAGASCAGSVTDLRAKAKKYGGERGKMYHWCANMKSGRNK